jgi:alkaline phosphatase
MLTASAVVSHTSAAAWEPGIKVGILTDLHYADTPDRGARNYRTSLPKMQTAVEQMNAQGVDFAVHGGDLIDALPDPDPVSEARFLKQINREFAKLHCPRHYVLGNHCIFSLTKSEYLEGIERPHSYYSFDHGAFHFVVLDACYRQDGVDYGRRNFDYRDTEIPPAEREWLAEDLGATGNKTIVFVHQRLDQPQGSEDAIHSAGAVRNILEDSGKVAAVFMGHSHVNDYHDIRGVHYCTLDAVVGGEGAANNAYSVLDIHNDGTLTLHGFCKHASNPMADRGGK